ncbi:hypothetical protein Lesp02_02160 [Lentzea sp. NBRC 105346]|nr:hypothetical protein Lesp02_02160 [Lentzea sp. NBRC 105346]
MIIGPVSDGLNGVVNDVEMMSEVLEERGFEVRRCVNDEATRIGILSAYDRLIADTSAGDAAFVGISCHGGLAAAPDGVPGDRDYLQFLSPTDIEASTPDDFRGLMSIEWSDRLAQLTAKTPNCTALIDACHSAHMFRDAGLRTKSLSHITYVDLVAHEARLRAEGLRVRLLDPESNPNAVRLVACGARQRAFERINQQGKAVGIMTEAFYLALREAKGLPVSWTTLVQRMRTRTMALGSGQRAEAEGPADRLLFDTVPGSPMLTLEVAVAGSKRVRLPGAPLLGFGPGDEFAIMPATEAEVVDSKTIGIATVDRSGGVAAEAVVVFQNGHTAIPAGARAHPISMSARRWPVLVRGDGAVADRLRAATALSPVLREPGPDDAEPLAVVDVNGILSLHDAVGDVVPPVNADHAGEVRTLANLTQLARAATLRVLSPAENEALPDEFTITWGLVENGVARPLPRSGALVHTGELAFVKVRNDRPQIVYCHLMDLGVAGAVRQLLAADPSGVALSPGEEYVFGANADHELVGKSLTWPAGTANAVPRPETILVLLATQPEDLSVLQQPGARGRGSSLMRLLTQAAHGGARTLLAGRAWANMRFAAHRIDFQLSPLPAAPVERSAFLFTDRLDRSVRLTTSGGSGHVVVRLHEFEGSDGEALRLDTLVITGDGVRAKTVTLPSQDRVIYEGPVRDHLDIAFWAGPVATDDRGLAQLLTLPDVDVARPAGRHAAEVAELRLVARTIDAAHDELSTVVPPRVALCRATFLAEDDFGAGRHPATGRISVGGYSFSFSID